MPGLGTGQKISAFVLLDIGVDDAADIVFVFFHFLEQAVVLVVFDVLVRDILEIRIAVAFDDRHAGALGFGLFGDGFFLVVVGGNLEWRLVRDGLDDLVLRLSLFRFLLLVLRLFVIGLGRDGLGGDGFRLTRAALFVERFRFEGERAFGTFDGPLLQVVEARRARRANAFDSEICLDQVLASHEEGCLRAASFATVDTACQRSSEIKIMHGSQGLKPLRARRSGALRGIAAVPGDKSISHRALILGALAIGETRITGLLEAEDVLNTAGAMRAFGADTVRDGEGSWRVSGRGVGGWAEPDQVLDFGNSGTGSRLVMGAAATTALVAVFTGDASLRRRPMARVLEPLTKFGAEYWSREGGLMPLTLRGASRPIAIDHEVAVASAQVKSALLLAALNAPGRSRIAQRALTRDHTEKMLHAFGATISVEPLSGGGEAVNVTGEAELRPCAVDVPRDPSSAAFAIVAALIVPGSEISVPAVLLNTRRVGLIDTLKEMGADIEICNARESGGEKIGDLVVRASTLKGVDVPAERAPSMIDEYPILTVAASFAEGRTTMRGLEELMVKESDRLSASANGLAACGVRTERIDGGLIVEGRGPDGVPGGARVATEMDHRIAMSFLVMGLAARNAVTVDDVSMIATSFPEFENLMRGLGADLQAVNS